MHVKIAFFYDQIVLKAVYCVARAFSNVLLRSDQVILQALGDLVARQGGLQGQICRGRVLQEKAAILLCGRGVKPTRFVCGATLLTSVACRDAISEHRRLSDRILRLDHGADEVQLRVLSGLLQLVGALRLLGRIKDVARGHDREVFFNVHLQVSGNFYF